MSRINHINDEALEFHTKRIPFYLDDETLLVRFPTSKHENSSHAEWFNDTGIPYLHTIRGYYYKDSENGDFIMIYNNDFEIPNMLCSIFTYLFDYFPDIKWIGVGCNKGKVGEIWKPKLTIYR